MKTLKCSTVLLGAAALALPGLAQAQTQPQPTAETRAGAETPAPAGAAEPVLEPAATQSFDSAFEPMVQPIPGLTDADGNPLEEVQSWTLSDARALLSLLQGIASEGLSPADYELGRLNAAIASGEGEQLNEAASQSFSWLIEDLRDGRTPMDARKQWFVVDPDRDRLPTVKVMADALASHDIAGVVDRLAPDHPDYDALKQALAKALAPAPAVVPLTAEHDAEAISPEMDEDAKAERIRMIRANMDRWRWLARDLGPQYLMTNVPEYQLRLAVNHKIIRTYRTIVGKPGRTATPQLAEIVEGVVFNPTWTVPQSIVKGEGLGEKVLNNPGWARSQGYKATRAENGYVSVVQQPGPTNSLGLMKLDMPNEHAIYLHDTPARQLFDREDRALSHGCIRTERALELAITMAIVGKGADRDEAVQISASREYTKVPLQKTFPVYITYFTMGRNIDGEMTTFEDIYDRDGPVLASLDQPRVADRARETSEEVVPIEAPGA